MSIKHWIQNPDAELFFILFLKTQLISHSLLLYTYNLNCIFCIVHWDKSIRWIHFHLQLLQSINLQWAKYLHFGLHLICYVNPLNCWLHISAASFSLYFLCDQLSLHQISWKMELACSMAKNKLPKNLYYARSSTIYGVIPCVYVGILVFSISKEKYIFLLCFHFCFCKIERSDLSHTSGQCVAKTAEAS